MKLDPHLVFVDNLGNRMNCLVTCLDPSWLGKVVLVPDFNCHVNLEIVGQSLVSADGLRSFYMDSSTLSGLSHPQSRLRDENQEVGGQCLLGHVTLQGTVVGAGSIHSNPSGSEAFFFVEIDTNSVQTTDDVYATNDLVAKVVFQAKDAFDWVSFTHSILVPGLSLELANLKTVKFGESGTRTLLFVKNVSQLNILKLPFVQNYKPLLWISPKRQGQLIKWDRVTNKVVDMIGKITRVLSLEHGRYELEGYKLYLTFHSLSNQAHRHPGYRVGTILHLVSIHLISVPTLFQEDHYLVACPCTSVSLHTFSPEIPAPVTQSQTEKVSTPLASFNFLDALFQTQLEHILAQLIQEKCVSCMPIDTIMEKVFKFSPLAPDPYVFLRGHDDCAHASIRGQKLMLMTPTSLHSLLRDRLSRELKERPLTSLVPFRQITMESNTLAGESDYACIGTFSYTSSGSLVLKDLTNSFQVLIVNEALEIVTHSKETRLWLARPILVKSFKVFLNIVPRDNMPPRGSVTASDVSSIPVLVFSLSDVTDLGPISSTSAPESRIEKSIQHQNGCWIFKPLLHRPILSIFETNNGSPKAGTAGIVEGMATWVSKGEIPSTLVTKRMYIQFSGVYLTRYFECHNKLCILLNVGFADVQARSRDWALDWRLPLASIVDLVDGLAAEPRQNTRSFLTSIQELWQEDAEGGSLSVSELVTKWTDNPKSSITEELHSVFGRIKSIRLVSKTQPLFPNKPILYHEKVFTNLNVGWGIADPTFVLIIEDLENGQYFKVWWDMTRWHTSHFVGLSMGSVVYLRDLVLKCPKSGIGFYGSIIPQTQVNVFSLTLNSIDSLNGALQRLRVETIPTSGPKTMRFLGQLMNCSHARSFGRFGDEWVLAVPTLLLSCEFQALCISCHTPLHKSKCLHSCFEAVDEECVEYTGSAVIFMDDGTLECKFFVDTLDLVCVLFDLTRGSKEWMDLCEDLNKVGTFAYASHQKDSLTDLSGDGHDRFLASAFIRLHNWLDTKIGGTGKLFRNLWVSCHPISSYPLGSCPTHDNLQRASPSRAPCRMEMVTSKNTKDGVTMRYLKPSLKVLRIDRVSFVSDASYLLQTF